MIRFECMRPTKFHLNASVLPGTVLKGHEGLNISVQFVVVLWSVEVLSERGLTRKDSVIVSSCVSTSVQTSLYLHIVNEEFLGLDLYYVCHIW